MLDYTGIEVTGKEQDEKAGGRNTGGKGGAGAGSAFLHLYAAPAFFRFASLRLIG